MKTYSDEQVLARVEGLPSFHGWVRGPYDVWIRSQADAYDQFDDKVFTYWCDETGKQPTFVLKCTGTSNAGSFGLMKFRTYNPLGCAILKSDELVYGSHQYGLHKGKPAYIQVSKGGFPYYRDGNMNRRAEEIGKVYYDRIGANCHRAGKHSSIINNWSVGCLVRNDQDEFLRWLGFLTSRGKPLLNVVILKEF